MKAVTLILEHLERLPLLLSKREKIINRELKEKERELNEQIFKIKEFNKKQEETK